MSCFITSKVGSIVRLSQNCHNIVSGYGELIAVLLELRVTQFGHEFIASGSVIIRNYKVVEPSVDQLQGHYF